MSDWIYVANWDKFQHYKNRHQPSWIKLHLDLLGNDAWLDLSAPDKVLLLTIWMLTGRYGNGRLKSDERWLKSQAKAHKSSLHRLVQAGFLTISASKAAPARRPDASPEGSTSYYLKNGDSGAAHGAPPRRRRKKPLADLSYEERREAERLASIEACRRQWANLVTTLSLPEAQVEIEGIFDDDIIKEAIHADAS